MKASQVDLKNKDVSLIWFIILENASNHEDARQTNSEGNERT